MSMELNDAGFRASGVLPASGVMPVYPYVAQIMPQTFSADFRARGVAVLELDDGRMYACPIVGALLADKLDWITDVLAPVCRDGVWVECGRRYNPFEKEDPMPPYVKLLFTRDDYDRTHGLSKDAPTAADYHWLKHEKRVPPVVTMRELYYD